jgi:hypothetical protein
MQTKTWRPTLEPAGSRPEKTRATTAQRRQKAKREEKKREKKRKQKRGKTRESGQKKQGESAALQPESAGSGHGVILGRVGAGAARVSYSAALSPKAAQAARSESTFVPLLLPSPLAAAAAVTAVAAARPSPCSPTFVRYQHLVPGNFCAWSSVDENYQQYRLRLQKYTNGDNDDDIDDNDDNDDDDDDDDDSSGGSGGRSGGGGGGGGGGDDNDGTVIICGKRRSPDMAPPQILPAAWGQNGSPLGVGILRKSVAPSSSMPSLCFNRDHANKSPRKSYYSHLAVDISDDDDDDHSKNVSRASPKSAARSSLSSFSFEPVQVVIPKLSSFVKQRCVSPCTAIVSARASTFSRPKSRRGGTRPSTAGRNHPNSQRRRRSQIHRRDHNNKNSSSSSGAVTSEDFVIDPRIPPATAWDWSK